MNDISHLTKKVILQLLWDKLTLVEKKVNTMATEAELDAALVDMKQAIADAAQRVIDKINGIIAAQPDLTDELAEVRDDIEKIGQIAPPTVPPTP